MKKQIFTIGHGNNNPIKLINCLKEYNIDLIVDIRSIPYSKYAHLFNKDIFEKTCNENGIKYCYLGDLLGGKPDDSSIINDSNKIDYYLLNQKHYFITGINKLLSLIDDHKVCIMCSEGQPHKCHRNLLVAPALSKYGVNISHILPDGQTINADKLSAAENKEQLALF